jgi:hypothetical protein
MKCLLTSIHARCFCTNVLCGVNDFYFDFFVCNNGLAVDAGHQMKKSYCLYVLTIIGGMIFVGSQAWEWKNFIKGDMVQSRQRGSLLQFVDKDGIAC